MQAASDRPAGPDSYIKQLKRSTSIVALLLAVTACLQWQSVQMRHDFETARIATIETAWADGKQPEFERQMVFFLHSHDEGYGMPIGHTGQTLALPESAFHADYQVDMRLKDPAPYTISPRPDGSQRLLHLDMFEDGGRRFLDSRDMYLDLGQRPSETKIRDKIRLSLSPNEGKDRLVRLALKWELPSVDPYSVAPRLGSKIENGKLLLPVFNVTVDSSLASLVAILACFAEVLVMYVVLYKLAYSPRGSSRDFFLLFETTSFGEDFPDNLAIFVAKLGYFFFILGCLWSPLVVSLLVLSGSSFMGEVTRHVVLAVFLGSIVALASIGATLRLGKLFLGSLGRS